MKKIILVISLLSVFLLSSCMNNSCTEKVRGNGNCEGFFVGYEYDDQAQKCKDYGVSGCSYETPFKTLEECQKACEKDK